MHEFCHRCHGALSPHLPDAASGRVSREPRSSSEALLFCPHCSAPQILFPEHMHAEIESTATDTTGAVPPPHPQQVDWREALPSAALVAGIGAVLTVIGLKVPLASLVCTLWVMGGAVMALGLYMRRRPGAWMDARTGLRIGLVTGLMMIAMMGSALALTGVAVRFGAHGMRGFDAQVVQQFETMQQQMTTRMQEQHQSAEFERKVLGFVNSQEVHGGLALVYLGVLGGLIVLLSAGGGAFAGMMRTRRHEMKARG